MTQVAAEAQGSAERIPLKVRPLWERYYPEQMGSRFRQLLAENIQHEHSVLEIGAGSGRNHQNHFDIKGRVARYAGIDPDPKVLQNPFLDESYCTGAELLPFADNTFDLVFHNYVAEHFESPEKCTREISRVLKPGGTLLFQTPSRYYYACLAAQATPQWFHEFYIQRFASGRVSSEVFPTHYRINDDGAIRREMSKFGLSSEIEHHSLPPGYLRFSRASFFAGMLYERTFERWFPALRATIIVRAKKISQS